MVARKEGRRLDGEHLTVEGAQCETEEKGEPLLRQQHQSHSDSSLLTEKYVVRFCLSYVCLCLSIHGSDK